jgi:subtilisin family serine protease
MLFRHHSRAFASAALLITLTTAFAGCQDEYEDEEFNGTISMLGGEVRVLTDTEKASVCAEAYCEPNYIYTASFGRSRKRRRPQPAPHPTTPPTAPLPPSILPSGDLADYSRARMAIPYAWNTTTGARDVVVAIVDTGVAIDHPDLAQNIWRNEAEANGAPGVDDDGNGYVDDVYGWDFANNRPNGVDDNGHGTHCAGIIAAAMNGMGVAGVAPNVRIMPLKFLSASGAGDTMAAIAAINYAVAMGARVISNSWGGGGRSELLNQAIQNAQARGVLVVAAAGNSSTDNDAFPNFPSNYDGVVSVASTDVNDNLSGFSNYGRGTVTIAAPGSNIFSTLTQGRYGFMSGTSMATPQVSGALALALSLHKSLSADEMKAVLCASTDNVQRDVTRCGRMNVAGLISAVSAR